MNFEFDKFVNDLEKRENQVREERRVESHIIDEDERRRRRARLYHERWQIKSNGRKNNGNIYIKLWLILSYWKYD